MEYVGPVYDQKIEDWEGTKKALKWLEKQDFIPSASVGPSGIGMTIKMALNIPSNKLPGPSGKYYVVKSKRMSSTGRITGFSKTPIWTEGWNPKSILEEFGYPNEKHEKNLMNGVTEEPNNQGIFLTCKDERIYLRGNNSKLGFFTEKMLIEGIKKSYSLIFIFAETRKDENYGEAFYFKDASVIIIDKSLTIKEIFRMVKRREMSMEFRMFLKENGNVRDHGFGFRFNSMDIFKERSIR